MKAEPRTFLEAVQHFADPELAFETLVALRWPDGVHCPSCGGLKLGFIRTRKLWECKSKECKRHFSVKVGTIFEDSAVPLTKWLPAIWLVANCKNGISSYEMARHLGVTQKTAWFMDHRIRLAMKAGSIVKMDGEVEADESYIGGLAKNMHQWKRDKIKVRSGRSAGGKAVVMAIIQRKSGKRSSKVKAAHVPNARAATLKTEIYDHVKEGATLYTDAWSAYRGLGGDFSHQVIDHSISYVEGAVHTNGVENFWSLLKRTIKGTYVSVEPFHLGRYLDEQSFRFNERDTDDASRFRTVLKSVTGRRLTYKDLTGNGEIKAPE